jgi:hypothetical protein
VSITSNSTSDVADLVFGNVTATASAVLSLQAPADMYSQSSTVIESPAVTVGTADGNIGLLHPLETATSQLNQASGAVDNLVDVANNLPTGTLTVGGSNGWTVLESLGITAISGNIIVNNVTQTTTNNGSIDIDALIGSIGVPINTQLTAQNGTIFLGAALGPIALNAGVQIAASANGSNNANEGNLFIEVGTPTNLSDCVAIPNFNSTGSAPVPQCGPANFTAAPPANTGFASGRSMIIYGPQTNSITLGGGVKLNALANAITP